MAFYLGKVSLSSNSANGFDCRVNAMQRLSTLILCALLGQPAIAGETVYLCRQNGKVTYAAAPRSGECQPVDLKVSRPSQAEVERLEREKERREAEQKTAVEQELQVRQVRAQEETAKAAKRQARAAEKQAGYEREQLRAQKEANVIERNRQPVVIFASPPHAAPRPVAPPSPIRPGVKIDLKAGGNHAD